jgi:hypothetical protein
MLRTGAQEETASTPRSAAPLECRRPSPVHRDFVESEKAGVRHACGHGDYADCGGFEVPRPIQALARAATNSARSRTICINQRSGIAPSLFPRCAMRFVISTNPPNSRAYYWESYRNTTGIYTPPDCRSFAPSLPKVGSDSAPSLPWKTFFFHRVLWISVESGDQSRRRGERP